MAITKFKARVLATLLVTLLSGCVHVSKKEVVEPTPAQTVVTPPPPVVVTPPP